MYCIEIGVASTVPIGLKETGPQGIQGIQGPQGIRGPSGDNTKYASEVVAAPTTGTLTLKIATESYIGTLTNANVFTVALPTPTANFVAESILVFKIGATLPTIYNPIGIVWCGAVPVLRKNSIAAICYRQINTNGNNYEVWGIFI